MLERYLRIQGEDIKMTSMTLADYFDDWIIREKESAVAKVTFQKYKQTGKWIRNLRPNLKIKDMDKKSYQDLLNAYGETHERQTTKDFHTQIKACITEMFEERIIDRNPTNKITIQGKRPSANKKAKFISLDELGKLIDTLDLSSLETMDWTILILAKTGLRFAECMGLTVQDFDFEKLTLDINKTWNYKDGGRFAETKNHSSIREIEIDWQIAAQLQPLIKNMKPNELVFIPKANGEYKRIHNSTYNSFLSRKCKEAGVTEITLHGLRHTHGSVLLGQGVSVLSVSKRLGHSNVTTTQEVYLHITDELERKDRALMMGALAGIK